MTAIAILGVFNADTTYRTRRLPQMGETVMGQAFTLGPGGKGSNQAVACSRLGASVTFISKVGRDPFADLAFALWSEAGVTPFVQRDATRPTGAACILVDDASGDNAIIVCPGAAGALDAADVDAAASVIRAARVFVAQLEQPVAAAVRGLEIARAAGVRTILNPAPACSLHDAVLELVDLSTPNAAEAAALTGIEVTDPASAEVAARRLLARGVGIVVVTLGAHGALLVEPERTTHVPAVVAGPVVETTGAGDAFNGGLAVALAEGMSLQTGIRFANAVASIAVTRAGAATSLPLRSEVDAVLGLEAP